MPSSRFAYISRLVCPNPAANTLQTLNMASAIASQNGEAHLFVHDLLEPEEKMRERYGMNGAPLRIHSLRTGRWPSMLYGNAKARFLTYNSAIAALFGLHPRWRNGGARSNVIFVRSRLDILYWGLNRPRLPWMKNWTLCCELHDLQAESERAKEALRNYDLVVAVTSGLADDIRAYAGAGVDPRVLPLCSGLPRLDTRRTVSLGHERITLGYVGKVDLLHGVDDLFRALELLPERYVLRLVGRVEADAREFLDNWLAADPRRSGRVEMLPHVDYSQVAAQIDGVDIGLLPAGSSLHRLRYTSPLKLFDYMARGKPVVAADVPSHSQLLQDGINARLYRRGDPENLARCIEKLADDPGRATAIAEAGWRESAQYTYSARAERLLGMLQEVGPR